MIEKSWFDENIFNHMKGKINNLTIHTGGYSYDHFSPNTFYYDGMFSDVDDFSEIILQQVGLLENNDDRTIVSLKSYIRLCLLEIFSGEEINETSFEESKLLIINNINTFLKKYVS